MCINAETSLTSFLLGTICNIVVYKKTRNPNYLMVAAIYEFILAMQLVDFLCWSDQKCGLQNRFATKFGFIFNMLAPVVIVLILLNYTQVTNKNVKWFVSFLLVCYVSTVFYNFYYNNKGIPITCLKPTSRCKHLKYDWWDLFKGKLGIFIFLLPIIGGFYFLLKSKKFAIIHLFYIMASFLISGLVYSCGIPSVFCLFATGGPLLNYFLMKYKV